jgi:hypothetical protein
MQVGRQMFWTLVSRHTFVVRRHFGLLALLALAVGCSDNGRPTADTASPAESATISAPDVFAQIELAPNEVTAGTTIHGQVVVTNNTGAAISATGCQSLFQVALSSPTYTPQILWLSCAQTMSIPVGTSSYPVTIETRLLGCVHGPETHNSSEFPLCVNGQAPPLPAGDYEARLYQSPQVVPDPDPVHVRVLPQ